MRIGPHYLTAQKHLLRLTLLRIAKVASGCRGNEGKMLSSAGNTVVCFQYPFNCAPNTKDRLAMAERPHWQPISRLALIGSMIDGMLQDAEEHYQLYCRLLPRLMSSMTIL